MTIAELYNAQINEEIDSYDDALGLAYDTIDCSGNEYCINKAKEEIAKIELIVQGLRAKLLPIK